MEENGHLLLHPQNGDTEPNLRTPWRSQARKRSLGLGAIRATRWPRWAGNTRPKSAARADRRRIRPTQSPNRGGGGGGRELNGGGRLENQKNKNMLAKFGGRQREVFHGNIRQSKTRF